NSLSEWKEVHTESGSE
ncbi:putative spfh domain / Band 7 family protein, partial [Schistosoma mansoni]